MMGGNVILDPILPLPVVALTGLGLSVLFIWVYGRTGARLPAWRRFTLLGLRLLGLALLLVILLQPSRIETIPQALREKFTLVALDSSRSMNRPDAGRLSRFDAARALLWDNGLASRAGGAPADVRLFQFAADASPVTDPLERLKATGKTTRFDRSINTMLDSLDPGSGRALFLMTDGHDFELESPQKTALAARNREVPIYAVAFGGEKGVRDVSVRIASFEPFYYTKQTIRIGGLIRQTGCSYETLSVTLLREGKPVQRRSVVIHQEDQAPVDFVVNEPLRGSFEYEIRVDPLPGEVDAENNSVVTYVNVIDKKIRILVLEGQPYWDTTFLQRSLRRDEKLDVDCAVLYARNRIRIIRTDGETSGFRLPGSAIEWRNYDAVILGRSIDSMLNAQQLDALEEYVDKQGGVVVFTRGDAFAGRVNDELQPVKWGLLGRRRANLKPSREGMGIACFKSLADAAAIDPGTLPPVVGASEVMATKPLAASMAEPDDAPVFPAMVHRRYGSGQVFSVGVDGLWRWAFNPKSDGGVYDRFWDQVVLWLLSGSDMMPQTRFTLRADTAHVLLGEKIHFRIAKARKDDAVPQVPLTLRADGREVAATHCMPDGDRLAADYLPERTGRYAAEARLPDGTTQSLRFIVYDDNLEETEVASCPDYLRRLCEASGGRLLTAPEFSAALREIRATAESPSVRTRKISLWDRPWYFWLMGAIFGADWYLRRKWGLC